MQKSQALNLVSSGRSAIGALLLSCLVALVPTLAHAEPMTDARMKTAASDNSNWLLYGRDYTNQRFSPLDSVNTGNVKKLVPKWIYQTGIAGTFQTTPTRC